MSLAAWSGYWQGTGRAQGCLPGAPPALAAALANGWTVFARSLPLSAPVLDLATGSGAVPRALLAVRPDLAVTGVDSAALPPGAPLDLRGGIDAAALPFADAAFDAVTSQFGIEYCPSAALAEAARALKPGGRLRFVLHHAGSRALAHNRARHEAIAALRDAGLFGLGRDVSAGRRPDPRRLAAIEAARRAHPGQSIADELPLAVEQALGSPGSGAAVDALDTKSALELARLAAMLAAALDRAAAERMRDALAAAGVPTELAMLAPDGAPDAFILEGRRG